MNTVNRDKYKSEVKERILLIVGLPFSVILWTFIFIGTYKYGSAAKDFLKSVLKQFYINLIGVFLIFIVGAILYWFRENKRKQYGIIEVSFALVSGWVGINKIETSGFVETITILTAIYLIVRGLDNYYIGVDDEWGKARKMLDAKLALNKKNSNNFKNK